MHPLPDFAACFPCFPGTRDYIVSTSINLALVLTVKSLDSWLLGFLRANGLSIPDSVSLLCNVRGQGILLMWQGRGESKFGSRLGQVNWTDFGALVARLPALANFLRRLWAKRGQVRPPLLGCSTPKQVGSMLLVSQGRRGSSSLPPSYFPKCLQIAGLPWPRPLAPVAPACGAPTARFPFGLCPAPRPPCSPQGRPAVLPVLPAPEPTVLQHQLVRRLGGARQAGGRRQGQRQGEGQQPH